MRKAEATIITIIAMLISSYLSLYIPQKTQKEIKQVVEIVVKLDNNTTSKGE